MYKGSELDGTDGIVVPYNQATFTVGGTIECSERSEKTVLEGKVGHWQMTKDGLSFNDLSVTFMKVSASGLFFNVCASVSVPYDLFFFVHSSFFARFYHNRG